MHVNHHSPSLAAQNVPVQASSGRRTEHSRPAHHQHHDRDSYSADAAGRSPQDVVESQVSRQVKSALKGEGVKLHTKEDSPKAEDNSPEATAQRILAMVEKGVANAGSEEERTALLGKAKEGIEKGFADAREVLDKMGLLQGDIASNIDKTFEKVNAGLERLADPNAQTGPQEVARAAKFSIGQVEAGAVRMAIQTADGDTVNVEISHEQGSAAIARAGEGGEVSGEGMSYSAGSIKFSVDGDLDDEEMKAITDLFDGVNKLAGQFFNGNLEDAFQQAQDLGFDSEQLSSLSLEMTHSVVRHQMATYQAIDAPDQPRILDQTEGPNPTPVSGQTQTPNPTPIPGQTQTPSQTQVLDQGQSPTPTQNQAPPPAPPRSPVGEAVKATGELRITYHAAQNSGFFAQADDALGQLFEGISKLMGQDEKADSFLSRIKDLLATIAGKKPAGEITADAPKTETGTPAPTDTAQTETVAPAPQPEPAQDEQQKAA